MSKRKQTKLQNKSASSNGFAIHKGSLRPISIAPLKFDNPQDQAFWNMIYDSRPEFVQVIVNHMFESGWQHREGFQRVLDEMWLAWYEDFTLLRLHCYEIDVAVRLRLSKNDLRLTLSKKYDAIHDALTDVKNGWDVLRQMNVDVDNPDPGNFEVNRPDVITDVQKRLEALKALYDGDGDDKPLRAIQPLKFDLGATLDPTSKKGAPQKGNKLDWLRKQWREYEQNNTDSEPHETLVAMLDKVADGDLIKGYQPKPNLKANEQAAYMSLMSRTAQVDVSAYRYNLIGRDDTKSRKK